jgi:hypothetical protein
MKIKNTIQTKDLVKLPLHILDKDLRKSMMYYSLLQRIVPPRRLQVAMWTSSGCNSRHGATSTSSMLPSTILRSMTWTRPNTGMPWIQLQPVQPSITAAAAVSIIGIGSIIIASMDDVNHYKNSKSCTKDHVATPKGVQWTIHKTLHSVVSPFYSYGYLCNNSSSNSRSCRYTYCDGTTATTTTNGTNTLLSSTPTAPSLKRPGPVVTTKRVKTTDITPTTAHDKTIPKSNIQRQVCYIQVKICSCFRSFRFCLVFHLGRYIHSIDNNCVYLCSSTFYFLPVTYMFA